MVAKLRYEPPGNWQNAKCKNLPLSNIYDPFFGVEEDTEEDEAKSHALDMCNGVADGVVCKSRIGCLLFALTNNEKYGVWGGTDEETRKGIRKKFPARRDGKPNPSWEWMSKEKALEGLNVKEIKAEVNRDKGE